MTRGTKLVGARVLITGGGSGMGRLMAFGAARRGAHVTVWDLSFERAVEVRDRIRAHGIDAEAYAVDVTDRQAVDEAALAVGPIDVLINNAGVVSGRSLLETTPESIERTLAVNLHALFWVTRAFLGGMVERGYGTVATVSSAAGLIGSAKQTDYAASKFGAVGFNEALRQEMRRGRTGVNTLVACPYYVNTGMFSGVKTRFPALLPILQPSRVATAILDGIEKGRQQIILPPFVRSVLLLRNFPLAVTDHVADFFGINKTMDDFTGRPGDRV